MMKTTEKQLFHVRWFVRRDMAEVLETEQASFALPWLEGDVLKAQRSRNTISLIAEQGERVVAHLIYELHTHRLEILRLAVHPAFRRFGVGRQMVAKLVGKLSSHRRTLLAVDVPDSDLGSHLFFKSQGFMATDILRGGDEGDDYRFEYSIGGGE